MNPGSEPERDDTGLPPVDIEIPDDARELDRDVQAYYREQRARRRQIRSLRLRGSLGRDGIVLPLLACCLILALITGTLLTVFSATSGDGRLPGSPGASQHATGSGGSSSAAHGRGTGPASPNVSSSAASSASSPAASPPAGGSRATASGVPDLVRTSGPLPDGTLLVGGRSVQLRSLSRAVLMLMPAQCGCGATVARLAGLAANVSAQAYLIATSATTAEVTKLATELAGRPGLQVRVATDVDGSLRSHYQHNGLTAIVIAPDKRVSVATTLKPGDNLTSLAQALAG